jgi:hypothetical protein
LNFGPLPQPNLIQAMYQIAVADHGGHGTYGPDFEALQRNGVVHEEVASVVAGIETHSQVGCILREEIGMSKLAAVKKPSRLRNIGR